MSEENKQSNEATILPFGEKFIHYPSLMRILLSIRNKHGRSIRPWTITPISLEMKNIFIDLIFHDTFSEKAYDSLDDKEKALFDKVLTFCQVKKLILSRVAFKSATDRQELLKRFEVLRGELLAGNDSKELLRQIKIVLFELRDKNYIKPRTFNSLMADVAICL